MPQQAWNAKRERQYEHIKDGLEDRGTSHDKAQEIAARTVNKERARAGGGTGIVEAVAARTCRPAVAGACGPARSAARAERATSSTARPSA